METFPPSYETATSRDVWAIVAPYTPSVDLCAASLVSKRWHEIFVPFLWGAPASHFGTENNAVYVALTRFRRTLKLARFCVRQLTHTLHLPPALSEIYGGPRSTWLRDVLEYLPNLQSLLVSRLPFFDHNSLVALASGGSNQAGAGRLDLETYDLRLLLAGRQPNATAIGLSEALLHFSKLVYLDLSYTTPSKYHRVLSVFSHLRDLQVLKLRGIGLRDRDVEVLASAIKTRVRLLDLRNNLLTDTALRLLIQECFMPESFVTHRDGRAESDWARLAGCRSDVLVPDSLKSEDLDDHLLQLLTAPLTGRSALEGLSHVGITHLYIAENNLSVEGLGSLLNTKRLHVLDGGTVDTVESIRMRDKQKVSGGGESRFVTTMMFPGAKKLIPILSSSITENLTYLRIHHAVITEYASHKDIFMAGLLPEHPTGNTNSDSDIPQEAELEAPISQRYELPSDSNLVFELPDAPLRQRTVPEAHSDSDQEPALNSSGTGFAIQRSPGSQSGFVPSTTDHPPHSEFPEIVTTSIATPPQRPKRIQELLSKRNGGSTDYDFLHPSSISHIRTLVLTDVPASVPASSPIIPSLIRFISACADESLLASLQAESDYSLPPGWCRINAELQHAKQLFALEAIVLEITPVPKTDQPKGLTPWTPHSYNSPGTFKSSTGDLDSENLWEAALNDFSFFGEEECGIPENKGNKQFPMSTLNEKVALIPEDEESVHSVPSPNLGNTGHESRNVHRAGSHLVEKPAHSAEAPREPDVDLVAVLAAFRRRKRAEYNELLQREIMRRSNEDVVSSSQASPIPPHVEGHWKGQVTIVRNPVPKQRSGV